VPEPPYQLLADLVLAVHFAIVVFVVGALPLILVGNLRGWAFVNGVAFRVAHLGAIAVVVAQAWLGVACPLTVLENRLRAQAGQLVYESSFIEHWLTRVLFYEASPWVFTGVYTLFGLAVAAAWWRFPPGRPSAHRLPKRRGAREL
jgi:polyferredoxin